METVVHTPGKLKVPGLNQAFREYQERINDYKLVHADGLPSKNFNSGNYLVALDRGGQQVTTEALADWLERKSNSVSTVRFLIGGKEGLDGEYLQNCGWKWSLGGLDLNQSIAALVVAEQLYRCFTIRSGHPYH